MSAILLCLCALAVLGGSPTRALAQAKLPGVDQDLDREAAPMPRQRLDMQALLDSDRVTSQTLDTPLWQIPENPRRRVVQVPIIMSPLDDQQAVVDSPRIDLRGGRFIGWRLDDRDPRRSTRPSRHRKRQRAGSLQAGEDLPPSLNRLLQQTEGDDGTDSSSPGPSTRDSSGPASAERGPRDSQSGTPQNPPPSSPTQHTSNGSDADLDNSVPPPKAAPRLARRLTITPDGKVLWGLSRVVPGAELKEGDSDYALKIRPERLREHRPAFPERLSRDDNETRSDYRERVRQQQIETRKAQQAYRQRERGIRNLPDRFQLPLPRPIWAVYDLSTAINTLEFVGPEPLPWRISLDDLTKLRALTEADSNDDEVGQPIYDQLQDLGKVAQSEHPYDQRLLALALGQADLLAKSQPNDPLQKVLGHIIEGKDEKARHIVIQSLVSAPPSLANSMLLSKAAPYMSSREKLLALRSALQGDASDTDQLTAIIDTTQRSLKDPQGAAPAGVLALLGQSVGDNPKGMDKAIAQINLWNLPNARRERALAYLIRSAGVDPLARRWLKQLLGGSDGAKRKHTLELLAQAATGDSSSGSAFVARTMVNMVFGRKSQNARNSGETDQSAEVANLNLERRAAIPINSPNHPMLRLINSGDRQLRTLGWAALPNFRVGQAEGTRRRPRQNHRPNASPDQSANVMAIILNAALGQDPTPASLIPFLVALDDQASGTDGLIRVVIEGDQPAAKQAAQALMDTKRELGQPLTQRSADQRDRFVTRLYELLRGQPVLLGGLLRQPTDGGAGQLIRWFTQQVARDGLPPRSAWVEAAGDQSNVLKLAASGDRKLAAAATAALVASAGGNVKTARQIARDWIRSDQRSVETLTKRWPKTKQRVHTLMIKQAAGSFRLVLEVYETKASGNQSQTAGGSDGLGNNSGSAPDPSANTSPNARGKQPKPKPDQRIVLAVVDLIVKRDKVRISNDVLAVKVPEDLLAIRVTDLSDLSAFNNKQVEQLKVGLVREPVDLTPKPNGVWSGQFDLPRQGRAQLRLEPIDEQAANGG